MAFTLPVMIDIASMVALVLTIALMFFILIKYFRGMRKPPFWLYMIGGFVVITFNLVLVSYNSALQSTVEFAAVRFVGHLLFLFGVLNLFKSHRKRIKFDDKLRE